MSNANNTQSSSSSSFDIAFDDVDAAFDNLMLGVYAEAAANKAAEAKAVADAKAAAVEARMADIRAFFAPRHT